MTSSWSFSCDEANRFMNVVVVVVVTNTVVNFGPAQSSMQNVVSAHDLYRTCCLYHVPTLVGNKGCTCTKYNNKNATEKSWTISSLILSDMNAVSLCPS